VVIGLFPTPDAAGQCITNLEEADFRPEAISVVMRTPQEAAQLANVSGRLTGVSVADLPRHLIDLGLAREAATAYADGVRRGGVFLAVAAGPASDAAKEMFQDARAQDIRIVGPD
jgi:hypothetical protein